MSGTLRPRVIQPETVTSKDRTTTAGTSLVFFQRTIPLILQFVTLKIKILWFIYWLKNHILIYILHIMETHTLDYASLAKKLEIQELESPAGRPSPQVYGQLLAIYLLFNDLTSAKFLWKRIPDEIKRDNNELSVIWTVGKMMWKKDYSEIYDTIKSFPMWPIHLKNIMNLILQATRNSAVRLITKAYSTMHISRASSLMGMTEDEMLSWASSNNWTFDKATRYFVINKANRIESNCPNTSILENRTELLEKLTDYIIFLETNTQSPGS